MSSYKNYANIDDDDFYSNVNELFAEYEIPEKQPSLEAFCFPRKFQLQIPQRFLSEFINPKTPYKRLLVYHQIGSGKTCASITVCETFKGKMNILVVLPATLIGGFRSELRSPCGNSNYLTKTEAAQLAKLDPASSEYKAIIAKSDARIDKVYTIYSYNKFIKLIKQGDIDFENTLLIIDEVHNMISETGSYYKEMYEVMRKAPESMRLMIMTATPIFDKPVEIALTMNLLITDPDKLMPTGAAFVKTFMDVRLTKKGYSYRMKNMDLFKSYIKGYVSYYRGAPPHVYPKAEVAISKVKMSDKQLRLYNGIVRREARMTKVQDFVNTDISNSFFIGTRMVSNFVFPNNKLGIEGFSSLKPSVFNLGNLCEFSPKFAKILRRTKKSDRTAFIYSNFKEYGGIKTFEEMLKYHGYVDYANEGAGPKRYAIWSGDQAPSLKDEIKAVFNNKSNIDGSSIKLILGSPSIKEGVTLLRVGQVHLIEPYWNYSRMDQIIGRAIRFCSHKDVDPDQQTVYVYIYLAVHPKLKKSVDRHIMDMAITKRKVNDAFNLAIKEAAVDCQLFKNANVYEGEYDYPCEI